jgi:hypothetical protein
MAGWFGEGRSEFGAVCVAVTSWWAFMLMVAQICTFLGSCVYLASVLILSCPLSLSPPPHLLTYSTGRDIRVCT